MIGVVYPIGAWGTTSNGFFHVKSWEGREKLVSKSPQDSLRLPVWLGRPLLAICGIHKGNSSQPGFHLLILHLTHTLDQYCQQKHITSHTSKSHS